MRQRCFPAPQINWLTLSALAPTRFSGLRVHVEVVYALPHALHQAHLELPDSATVAQALQAVSRLKPFSDLDLDAATVGVYGRIAEGSRQLAHGDRLEIYRPLQCDPMQARRQRAINQKDN